MVASYLRLDYYIIFYIPYIPYFIYEKRNVFVCALKQFFCSQKLWISSFTMLICNSYLLSRSLWILKSLGILELNIKAKKER